jgi:hypothetical protein
MLEDLLRRCSVEVECPHVAPDMTSHFEVWAQKARFARHPLQNDRLKIVVPSDPFISFRRT